MQPKLTLVGAGPGDPELISLKGVKALGAADVVMYDALSNDELLQHAPDSAEIVYVGKRSGDHRYSQDEINALIVEKAKEKGHVVRLKGGDPFVFGRGHEELDYAAEHGLEVELVPGITSAIAVAEMQGIPYTRRGINESFWVITGTTSSGEISSDVELAAQSTATVVILMGSKKLAQISEIFSKNGKANTPVAIIQNGTRPDEKIALATISTIEQKAAEAQIGAPAIIVIGEVAGLHKDFVN